MPQWSSANTPGGTYTGWEVTIYTLTQTAIVKPSSEPTPPKVKIDTTTKVTK